MRIARGRTRGGMKSMQMLDSKPGRLDPRKRLSAQQVRISLGASADAMRRALGLTVRQIATGLGWTVGLVESFLAGKMTPSEGQHADLARWAKECRKKMEAEAAACQAPYELASLAQRRVAASRKRDG